SLTYASAGHPAGHVLDPGGEVKAKLPGTGCPLGVDAGSDFPVEGPVALRPGDVVVLLSDGVVEAVSPGGEHFGGRRALEAVRADLRRPARAIVEGLLEAAREVAGGAPVRGDPTAGIIKVGGERGVAQGGYSRRSGGPPPRA